MLNRKNRLLATLIKVYEKGENTNEKKLHLCFLLIAIVVAAVSYIVNPPIEQAPVENKQQLTANNGASPNGETNNSNEMLNVNSNYEACGKVHYNRLLT